MLDIQDKYGYWPVPNDKVNLNEDEKHLEDLELSEDKQSEIEKLPAFGCGSETLESAKYNTSNSLGFFSKYSKNFLS